MEIPADIQILSTIKTGSVYYFEEETFVNSEEPHYFIVLNKNPRTEDFVILVCASSKVSKRQSIAIHLGFPPETLVVIQPQEYPLFKCETIIDCNNVFEKSIQTLISKLEKGELRLCAKMMPETIVQKLIKGVLKSNQVSIEVQETLANNSVQPDN